MNTRNLPLKVGISVILLITVIVAAAPFFKYFMIATSQQFTSVAIHDKMPDKIQAPQDVQPPTVKDIISGVGPARNSDGTENLYAVGEIVIPKVSIGQPVYAGLTPVNMVRGTVDLFPGRDPDKQTPVIIGHHVLYYNWGNWLLFGGVQQLKANDDVYLRYMNRYYAYKVESNVTIKDTEVNRLADKGPDYLILVTCNQATTTPYRVLVTAKKVGSIDSKTYDQQINKLNDKSLSRYLLTFVLPILILLILLFFFVRLVWRL
ncbi:MAG: class A sortase [Streptococcaceae bacterium]|nr:class A sortase [Streptococcaceae bacterium]